MWTLLKRLDAAVQKMRQPFPKLRENQTITDGMPHGEITIT
jgi:hypothetical protein